MSFRIGEKVVYARFSTYKTGAPVMIVEFVQSDRITCSYVENDASGKGVVRVITLNEASLERVPD